MKFKYTFAVAWLITKENSSYSVLNFHLVWNTSRYERLYVCLFVFMVLFFSSFGSRSERPRALQLLIKMVIRWCLIWEGLVLLYQNFYNRTQPRCFLMQLNAGNKQLVTNLQRTWRHNGISWPSPRTQIEHISAKIFLEIFNRVSLSDTYRGNKNILCHIHFKDSFFFCLVPQDLLSAHSVWSHSPTWDEKVSHKSQCVQVKMLSCNGSQSLNLK